MLDAGAGEVDGRGAMHACATLSNYLRSGFCGPGRRDVFVLAAGKQTGGHRVWARRRDVSRAGPGSGSGSAMEGRGARPAGSRRRLLGASGRKLCGSAASWVRAGRAWPGG
jgi:hypothetical protein